MMSKLLYSPCVILSILLLSLILSAQDRRLERPRTDSDQGLKRLALVIGNERYQKISPLKNPVNDAGDMAAALEGLGFEVLNGTDANLVQMRRLIREFGEKLDAQKGVGLFFYAGHGVEVRGKNFLIPVDADIAREVETEDYAIDVNSILRQMDAANNGFNIVILDACRNNPFSSGWNRSGDSGGLANVNAPTGSFIAYAAAPGKTASDGKGGRNGVFTGALLENLKKPDLKLEEVFKSTREDVIARTENKQVPWDSSSLQGDFFFNRTSSGDTTNVTTITRKDSSTIVEPVENSAPKTAGDISRSYLAGSAELTFAYIPEGEFKMGSDNWTAFERPVHSVKLTKGFWLQTTEVTQAQWKAVMGGLPPAKCDIGNFSGSFVGNDKPVICVSWDDVNEFLRLINEKDGKFTYRLPTEAEWEYAARSGTATDFPGELDEIAWYSVNSGNSTHAVGTKKPNAWGLYDMNGNVLEWVQDLGGKYPDSDVTDPTGLVKGAEPAYRGGSWNSKPDDLRYSRRYTTAASKRYFFLGFRLVRQ